ncbi:hypothetical protein ABZY58_11545 [Micromonospora tulbaghiae]|uniref:hypothetical protein n=1 Tax=Micromonospora tulbaghiae TaxID=479978 RepID=UPI0033AAB8A3
MTTTTAAELTSDNLLTLPNYGRGTVLLGRDGVRLTVDRTEDAYAAPYLRQVRVWADVTAPTLDTTDPAAVRESVLWAFPALCVEYGTAGRVAVTFRRADTLRAEVNADTPPHGCDECSAAPGEPCREYNCQGSWI